MPWEKKPGAPDYMNGLQRIRIVAAGTGDDWLIPWLSLIPWGDNVDVNAFCALGPPEEISFGIEDFLPAVGAQPWGAIGAAWGARDKLKARVRELLFADLCQSTTTSPGLCTLFQRTWTDPGGSHYANLAYPAVGDWIDLPTGILAVKVTYTGGGTGLGDVYSNNLGYTDFRQQTWNPGVAQEAHTFVSTARHMAISRTWPAGVVTLKIEYACDVPDTFHPAAAPAPASALLPPPKVYTTIADLGAELDEIENKLHWILDYEYANNVTNMPNVLMPDATLAVDDPDVDVPLGPDVMGFIVTLSAIPGSADERFGEPVQLHNLGRVVMGNGTAWMPPIPLTVTPMLILKPDPSINVCRVHTWPPTTASVLTLVKPPLP